jgi:hypothetical protein
MKDKERESESKIAEASTLEDGLKAREKTKELENELAWLVVSELEKVSEEEQRKLEAVCGKADSGDATAAVSAEIERIAAERE